jgi:serine protease Do
MNLKPLKVVASLIAIGAVAVSGGALMNTKVDAQNATAVVATNTAATTPAALTMTTPNFAELVDRYGPAVVNISVETRGGQRQSVMGADDDDEEGSGTEQEEFFRRFFQLPRPDRNAEPKGDSRGEDRWGIEPGQRQPQQRAQPRRAQPDKDREPLRTTQEGSGFIVSNDGYLISNAHVVDGAEVVYVTLTDRRQFRAKVVGADKRTDIAILKIDGTNLPTVQMGDVTKLRTGEWVVAIGSPYGFENSVTAGIVSAKNRDSRNGAGQFGELVPFIQTDVAVNPGNSGGPLFNTRGEVVGVNSQIYSRTGAYAGISFSIPIDVAMDVYKQIREAGKVVRSRIGVQIGSVPRAAAEGLGLKAGQGASVGSVMEDMPAAAAGIKAGDIILKINGRTVESSSDVSRTIASVKPGSKINLTIMREGKEREMAVTVAELKDPQSASAKTEPAEAKPKAKISAKDERLGVVVADLSAELKKKANVNNGVVVEDVAGGARTALEVGDIIVQVNGQPVTSAMQFKEVATKTDINRGIAMLVKSPRNKESLQLRSYRVEQ